MRRFVFRQRVGRAAAFVAAYALVLNVILPSLHAPLARRGPEGALLRLSGMVVLILLLTGATAASDTVETSRALAGAALESDVSWEVLAYLADVIGPRLSGSAGAEQAVEWTTRTMREWGLFVRQEPVKVPVWVRGVETASLTSHGNRAIHVTALGRSVSTPAEGIEAEVIDLRTLSPLEVDAIISSIRKTGRGVIVHEAPRTCGPGAEIIALMSMSWTRRRTHSISLSPQP